VIAEPEFRVVRGYPTDEETAALALVLAAKLAARGSAGREPAGRPASRAGGWADRARALHILPAPGPGAWRRSALPG
jgi:hypothetical protein